MLDDLQALVRENVRSRQQDLAKSDQIIDSRASALMAKLRLEIDKPQLFLRPSLSFLPT